MRRIILCLFLFISSLSFGQFGSLSDQAEISILTIEPGKHLYDKFGHSAFRIKDSLSGVDVVFNYGVYDFNTPNFYLKFARGTMMYELGVTYYSSFLENYKAENRGITEQQLNLTKEEKQAISDFLWNNALPENKKYRYDYFYDNCATKIRDVLLFTLDNRLEYHDDYIDTEYTLRQLIQKNLHPNSWGSLGINLALGSVIDRKASPMEYQFLPDYVYRAAKHATITHNGNTEPLVKEERVLFESTPTTTHFSFFSSPLFIFSLVSLIIIGITIHDLKRRRRNKVLDVLIFTVTGILGFFLLFLWFATDHTAAAYNYNLLWAFPLSLFAVFYVVKKPLGNKMKKYYLMLILMLTLLFLHWMTGVQQFAIGLLPVFIALFFRYLIVRRYF